MKILIDSASAAYRNTAHTEMKNPKSVPLDDANKKFDQIMIHSNSRQLAESKMTENAQKAVKSAVYQTIPEEKIAALKEQVSQGMYKVDSGEVAARILLMK